MEGDVEGDVAATLAYWPARGSDKDASSRAGGLPGRGRGGKANVAATQACWPASFLFGVAGLRQRGPQYISNSDQDQIEYNAKLRPSYIYSYSRSRPNALQIKAPTT
jgi:hypothetical protein